MTAVLVIAAIVLLVASPWSDDATTEQGTDATSTTRVGVTDPAGPGAPDSDTTEGPAKVDDPPAAGVPSGTVAIGQPGETCRAVVERLREYSEAAKKSSVDQLEPLFQKLSDFEADIFTFAQGEAWGDRIIEQLVVVRRGWVDAGSAEGQGDTDQAKQHASQANEKLDAIIADAPCP